MWRKEENERKEEGRRKKEEGRRKKEEEDRDLFLDGFDETWMAMALVDGRISREKVEIRFALDVLNDRPRTPRQYDGERVIVVGSVLLLHCDVVGGRESTQTL